MKVSDYITDFLINIGVTDCFGYPGGSVTNLLESIRRKEPFIRAHVTYHEQGAAFAACGYAVTSGKIGMAYSTGGPGCTNLVTGICHAYYDSIPVLFLTGNVNTYESKGDMEIRQKAFQEFDNVSAVKSFTKYAAYVESAEKIRYYLEKAYCIATSGRPGPVLLDLPMDVQRAQIEPGQLTGYESDDTKLIDDHKKVEEQFSKIIRKEIQQAQRPCFILGNGIKNAKACSFAKHVVEKWDVPYVTSMIAFDVIGAHPNYCGFLGAYGSRSANFVVAKSDLLIAIGSRLDIRQVGVNRENFAPDAKIIRIDIDEEELKYKVHNDEWDFQLNVKTALQIMETIHCNMDFSYWKGICKQIKCKLKGIDFNEPNEYLYRISKLIPDNTIITTDVGQNQVWMAQSWQLKNDQEAMFSGGFGSMGHALPAAIGAHYGNPEKHIVCICGDGGLQMNIQELQYIAREHIPVKIIVFNNNALGMIRHFQEMYFESEFYQTKPEGGYTAPDFSKIATAYGIRAIAIESLIDIEKCCVVIQDHDPVLIEIKYFNNTYIIPKLKFGMPNQDQEPLLDRNLYNYLMNLE